MNRRPPAIALFLVSAAAGLLGGFFSGRVGRADASRNGSGVYSLPAGNPVVTKTLINSGQYNGNMNDIATELTNSLDRGGRGCMTGPLQIASGTQAAPGLAFCSETGTGLYRIGLNNIALAVGGGKVEQWTTTADTLSLQLSVTPVGANQTAIIAQGTGTNFGIQSTGGTSGNPAGIVSLGGATDGVGVIGRGSGAGAGVQGSGNYLGGTGRGGLFQGGGTSDGVTATGGNTAGAVGIRGTGGVNGGDGVVGIAVSPGWGGNFTGVGKEGLTATGGAGSAGGIFSNGTASLAGTPQNALTLVSGNMLLSPAVNPTNTVAFTNTFTPVSMAKAWGIVTCAGNNSTTCTLDASGFNVTSAQASNANSRIEVTLASAMSGNYAILVTPASVSGVQFPGLSSAGSIIVSSTVFAIDAYAFNTTGPTITHINPFTNVNEPIIFYGFVVFGRQ